MDMTNPETIALAKSVTHFLSSGAVGLLVYWLTSTTLMYYFRKASLSRQQTSSTRRVARGIFLFSFSLALFSSLLAHMCIDFATRFSFGFFMS